MLTALSPHSLAFPAPAQALSEPNGLLAVGGDLSVARLRAAYQQGIFPWFSDGDPILWWSPSPRGVIFPQHIHVSRSLRKFCQRSDYQCTWNQAFEQVISACADARSTLEGTWITDDMLEAYCDLHDAGHAYSIEVWRHGTLVGGLYGVLNGAIFCGESMFHRADNASKVALLALRKHLLPHGLRLIDCQMPTPHLQSLGLQAVPRAEFLTMLEQWSACPFEKRILHPQPIEAPFIGNYG